jgi:hypothetical protein
MRARAKAKVSATELAVATALPPRLGDKLRHQMLAQEARLALVERFYELTASGKHPEARMLIHEIARLRELISTLEGKALRK